MLYLLPCDMRQVLSDVVTAPPHAIIPGHHYRPVSLSLVRDRNINIACPQLKRCNGSETFQLSITSISDTLSILSVPMSCILSALMSQFLIGYVYGSRFLIGITDPFSVVFEETLLKTICDNCDNFLYSMIIDNVFCSLKCGDS